MTSVSQSPHTPRWNSRKGTPQPVNAPSTAVPMVPAARDDRAMLTFTAR